MLYLFHKNLSSLVMTLVSHSVLLQNGHCAPRSCRCVNNDQLFQHVSYFLDQYKRGQAYRGEKDTERGGLEKSIGWRTMVSYSDMDRDTRSLIVWGVEPGWHNRPGPHGGLRGVQTYGPVLCLWQEATATVWRDNTSWNVSVTDTLHLHPLRVHVDLTTASVRGGHNCSYLYAVLNCNKNNLIE